MPLYESSRSIQSAAKSACLRMMFGLLAKALLEPVPHAGMRRTGELQTSNVLPLACERRSQLHEPWFGHSWAGSAASAAVTRRVGWVGS